MSETVFASRSDKTADRSSGKSIGWSGSGCDDDGNRNYGIHAGGCRTFAIIPCSDGLCDYRWCNGIQSCE